MAEIIKMDAVNGKVVLEIALQETTQTWHNRIVAGLMHSSCGDLILNNRGHLCTRRTYEEDTYKDIPWEQHRPGERLACVTDKGLILTSYGAEYILENSIFEKADYDRLVSIRSQNDAHLEGYYL